MSSNGHNLTTVECARLYQQSPADDAFGLPGRMAGRVAVDLDTGCWLVAGSSTGKGHAKVSVFGRDLAFHRVAYNCLVGPIPEAHVLDHVRERGCRHRNCANPAHLEPVTVAVNTARGDGVLYQFRPRRAA